MKKILQNNFTIIFFFILAVDLYASTAASPILNIIFKPLIVISLLVYLFILEGNKKKAVAFAVTGLLLSLMGDVLLIFQEQNALFFMGGLVSFLLAHVSYIFYYLRSSDAAAEKKLGSKNLIFLLMISYGLVFFLLLSKNLGDLKVPVLVYTTALVCMNIFALNRYGKVNDSSFKLIMTGALCFLVSDSLLALNKFLLPIPFAGLWIMASYGAAQFFITKGVLSGKE